MSSFLTEAGSEIESWFVVTKADGSQRFFAVRDVNTVEISEAEYNELENN